MFNVQHPSSRTRKMLPGVNGNCAYSNKIRHHNSTPKRTPIANIYGVYQHALARNAIGCRVIIVTTSVSDRDQTTAPSRTTSDTATARNTLTLTAHETCMLPGDRHHCHSISLHSATHQLRSLERQRHATTSASPVTVTHPSIYKSGRLSNVTSSLSQHPSRSATKQLRTLERRVTSRLRNAPPPFTYIP